MTEEQIEWLKDNLDIRLNVFKAHAYYDTSYIEILLLLDGQIISESRVYE